MNLENPARISKDHHLPGLNSLRFIAAAVVVAHHIEQFKYLFHLPNLWLTTFVNRIGGTAVTFFFVLSGYLISYLLFLEKEDNGTIAIKQFYLRRVLRIWPLYYTVITTGLFLLPLLGWFYVPGWSEGNEQGFSIKLLLYYLMVPNLVTVLYPPFPGVAQVWSIGVEEQFYLVWPHMFRIGKNIVFLFIGLLTTMIFTRKILDFNAWLAPASSYNYFYRFVEGLKFGSMAIGGIGAWLVHYRQRRFLNWLYHPTTQIAAIVIPLLRLRKTNLYFLEPEMFSVFFIIIILNVSTNPKSILKLQQKWLDSLGKISFGIYMYHIPVIIFVAHLVTSINNKTSLFALSPAGLSLAMYGLSFSITLAVAQTSYTFLEKPFLRLKRTGPRDKVFDEIRNV